MAPTVSFVKQFYPYHCSCLVSNQLTEKTDIRMETQLSVVPSTIFGVTDTIAYYGYSRRYAVASQHIKNK